jgi:Zn-dependent protease with chaperone function
MTSQNEFSALCFGPNLPPGGQRVSARVTNNALEVELGDGRIESVLWFTLQISSGGFDHQQMLLAWSRGDAHWSLMPVDAAAREVLLRHAPNEMQVRLAQWNKRVGSARRGFRIGWAVLGFVVASPLLLLLLFWLQSERIVGWVVDQVSIETERELGKIAFAQVEAGTALIKEGKAVEVIRAMGAKLTQGSRYDYQWFIAKDAMINAYAIPGGFVVVNAGLIQAADNAEEVAGVLAHEVQHVERRHSLKGMVHNLGLSAVLNLALGDVGGGVWAGMATQLATLKYGREHESEADRLGLATLNRAGVDAHGMLRFFEKLNQQDGGSIALLSTHPATADRLAALEQAVRESGVKDAAPLPYDWNAVKAELAR